LLQTELMKGELHIVKTTTHFKYPNFFISHLRECGNEKTEAFIEAAIYTMKRSKLVLSERV